MLVKAREVSRKTGYVVGRDVEWRSCYEALFGRISIECRQAGAADASTVKAGGTAGASNTLESVQERQLDSGLGDVCECRQAKHGIWRAAAMM
jgi:hypothetical protein